MGEGRSKRMLREQAIGAEREGRGGPARPVRSVTVNAVESPLGWLLARGLLTQRQFDAGERLRGDWERAQFQPRVTMAWSAAPVASRRGGAGPEPDLGGAQLDARRRFDAAIAGAGPASPTSCGAWSAPGRGCATPRRRWAGRRGPASWC